MLANRNTLYKPPGCRTDETGVARRGLIRGAEATPQLASPTRTTHVRPDAELSSGDHNSDSNSTTKSGSQATQMSFAERISMDWGPQETRKRLHSLVPWARRIGWFECLEGGRTSARMLEGFLRRCFSLTGLDHSYIRHTLPFLPRNKSAANLQGSMQTRGFAFPRCYLPYQRCFLPHANM
jgi:hypothetical protein